MTRTVSVLLAFCAIGCASGNSGGADASTPDASTPDASIPDASFPDASTPDGGAIACPSIAIDGGLVAFVDRVTSAMEKSGGAGSDAAVIPSASDRDDFAANVLALLSGSATACALPASYRAGSIAGGAATFVVVAEMDDAGNPSPSLFWGTYAAKVGQPLSRVIVEAPHPLFDLHTEHEAAELCVQIQAGGLLIAGAHRCADPASSGCSGTTDACGTTAPYRISDAAHSVDLPFNAVHDAISRAVSAPFLQLHGNTEPCPAALVSDGSGSFADGGLAAAFATALENNGVSVGRCGLGFPSGGCDLCATDNVQARFTAGSADACTQAGASYARFVHVEQQPALRESPDAGVTGYAPLIRAAAATFP
jgi:hypothetical protein